MTNVEAAPGMAPSMLESSKQTQLSMCVFIYYGSDASGSIKRLAFDFRSVGRERYP